MKRLGTSPPPLIKPLTVKTSNRSVPILTSGMRFTSLTTRGWGVAYFVQVIQFWVAIIFETECYIQMPTSRARHI